MAEEKKTPVKAEEGKGSKFVNWIKNLPGNIAKPFKNMVAELRKVTWPSKKKLISSVSRPCCVSSSTMATVTEELCTMAVIAAHASTAMTGLFSEPMMLSTC